MPYVAGIRLGTKGAGVRIPVGKIKTTIGPHAHAVKTLVDMAERDPPHQALKADLARIPDHVRQAI